MKNKLIIWLLLVAFIKGIVWILLTPIFQIPDEPSHFSYIQFLAEKKRLPHPRSEVVTSRELFQAAQSVNFNWQIEHPVWRGYNADWREQIKAIGTEARREFIFNPYLTSLKRPVLYYYLSSLVYFLGSSQDFLVRFYLVRFFSLLIHLLTVWLTYRLALKLTEKKIWVALASAAFVAFHPGFSFISSGISYEALGALATTLFLYLSTAKKSKWWLALAALAGIMIKPDLIFLWFLLFGVKLVAVMLGFGLLLPLINQTIVGKYPFFDAWLYALPIKDYSLAAADFWQALRAGQIATKSWEYLKIFIGVHYHQIFAWYWGVFGWLEKTLPLPVYTLLKITLVASIAGLAKAWRRYKLLISAVILQAAIVFGNDWLAYVNTGKIYGIQGRYFYAAISAQMILLAVGLSRFISPKILLAGAFGLNIIGLLSLYQYFGWVWR